MRRMVALRAALVLLSLVLASQPGASALPHSWPGFPALPFPHLREENNTTPPPPDITPPSLALTSHKDRETVKEPGVTLRGSSSDESGVRSVEVMVNGRAWVTASGNATWSVPIRLEEGSNTVLVRATDFAGNTAQRNISLVLSAPIKENSGVLLAAAIVIPIVVMIVLFATRRRPRPAAEMPEELGDIEKRLAMEGKKRDPSGAGLGDSKEATRIDGRPARKKGSKGRQ